MKNKKLHYIVLLLVFFLFAEKLTAQNWFPMEVGNEWQYLVYQKNSNLYGGTEKYYLQNYIVTRDTTIAGNTYYNWSRYPEFWFRYDLDIQTIYVWWNSSDNVFMDFTIPPHNFITRFEPFSQYYFDVLVIELGDSKGFEGYENYEWPELIATNLFVKGFGYNYRYSEEAWPGGFREKKWYNIIQSNISRVNHSENYNPEIVIDPITGIRESSFNLLFEVNHHYNHIYPDTTPHTSLNFIDTVKMYSFYSKGSTIIENPIIYAESISATEEWELNTIINMNLIRDEYKFNYMIEAIDKGLVPHRSFAPDTGYFVAVYDTTTNVNETDGIVNTFELYQNYPNPFNSITKIKFAMPRVETYRDAFLQMVTLKVYDILGNEIVTIVNEEKPAGEYEVEFNASELPSGIYFYQLRSGSFLETRKMVLLR